MLSSPYTILPAIPSQRHRIRPPGLGTTWSRTSTRAPTDGRPVTPNIDPKAGARKARAHTGIGTDQLYKTSHDAETTTTVAEGGGEGEGVADAPPSSDDVFQPPARGATR